MIFSRLYGVNRITYFNLLKILKMSSLTSSSDEEDIVCTIGASKSLEEDIALHVNHVVCGRP